MASGSWSLAEELFARGDDGFVDELRRVHNADRLGGFAARWMADPRPFARAALFDYLSRPLNCYRHEALVKRLFKLAEKAGDDALMGAFLVAFDRTIRRNRTTRRQHKYETFNTRAQAEGAIRAWAAEGFEAASINEWSGKCHAYATKSTPAVIVPGNTTMPRPADRARSQDQPIPDAFRKWLERRFVLFSLPTRRYLRRRTWRYFRLLGKADAARYLKAAIEFLVRYTDADIDSDIHLLDNWGLTHALFHDSPVLERPASGWKIAPGKSFTDLGPAPYLESAWAADGRSAYVVLLKANCRAMRHWAAVILRRYHERWLASQPVVVLLILADHPDPDLSALGFDLLDKAADLSSVPVEEWLSRLEGDDLEKLRRLSDLLTRRLDPARVATADAIRLAGHRSKPVAELGLALLREKLTLLRREPFTATDAAELLPLVQAECDSLRPDLIRWLRGMLGGFDPVPAEWVLEFLDSKHADVRAAGWDWLNSSPLVDDPAIWHKIIESPYDDVRERLTAELAKRVTGGDPDRVRLLWATVLLNVARGGRRKPGVVRQIVARLSRHPTEADRLLPLMAMAVRSVRGPEFRVGLAGIVGLAEEKAELAPAIRRWFPELQLDEPAAAAAH